MSLIEIMIVLVISAIVMTVIVTFFLFNLKTSMNTQSRAQIEESVLIAMNLIHKEMIDADAIYIDESEEKFGIYIRRQIGSSSYEWSCFYFAANAGLDKNGFALPGTLYYIKETSSGVWGPPKVIADQFSSFAYSFADTELHNFVKVDIGFVKETRWYTRSQFMVARNVTITTAATSPVPLVLRGS